MEKDMQCSSIIPLKWRVKACEIPFQCPQLSLNPSNHSDKAITYCFLAFSSCSKHLAQGSQVSALQTNESCDHEIRLPSAKSKGRWFFKIRRKPSSTLISLFCFCTKQVRSPCPHATLPQPSSLNVQLSSAVLGYLLHRIPGGSSCA